MLLAVLFSLLGLALAASPVAQLCCLVLFLTTNCPTFASVLGSLVPSIHFTKIVSYIRQHVRIQYRVTWDVRMTIAGIVYRIRHRCVVLGGVVVFVVGGGGNNSAATRVHTSNHPEKIPRTVCIATESGIEYGRIGYRINRLIETAKQRWCIVQYNALSNASCIALE